MKSATVLLYAVVGWGLCGAIIWLGMALAGLETALIVHMIGEPIIFILLSILYFKDRPYTSPLQTAFIFLGAVIFLAIFVVALVIEKNFEMFRNPAGTWIPFILIFSATYLTGRAMTCRR